MRCWASANRRFCCLTPGTERTRSENLLYYGDNLDILRHYLQDESVDLIYEKKNQGVSKEKPWSR